MSARIRKQNVKLYCRKIQLSDWSWEGRKQKNISLWSFIMTLSCLVLFIFDHKIRRGGEKACISHFSSEPTSNARSESVKFPKIDDSKLKYWPEEKSYNLIYAFKLNFLLSKTHNKTHNTVKLNIILSPKIELKN